MSGFIPERGVPRETQIAHAKAAVLTARGADGPPPPAAALHEPVA